MERHLHSGHQDGLQPLEPLNVTDVTGFADLLARMEKTAFGGRELGEAFRVFKAMADDPECTIIVTMSGAMTVAKMGRVLCDMLDNGLAHILISTGALMAHGLSEAAGGTHFKHDPRIPDAELYLRGYNRVYDTVETEANMLAAEDILFAVLRERRSSEPACSSEICRLIGQRLSEQGVMPSILGCAYRRNVPVYIPAFTDSDLGLAMAVETLLQTHGKEPRETGEKFFSAIPNYNPFRDMLDYAHRLVSAKRLGIFTIGGGVPRNWGQQIAPFFDILNLRLGTSFPVPRIRYAVRICPEPVHWGGLSGCTYEEGVSWGKFVSREQGGQFAEVHCDATIAWPILVRAILETKGKRQKAKGKRTK